jgi:hypothetical protein
VKPSDRIAELAEALDVPEHRRDPSIYARVDALIAYLDEEHVKRNPPTVAVTILVEPGCICRMCGKTYGEHLDFRPVGTPAPRNGCGSLKAYFRP